MLKKYNLTDEDIDFLFDFVRTAMVGRYSEISHNPFLTEKAKKDFAKDAFIFYEMDNEDILKRLKFTTHQTILFPQFVKHNKE